MSAPTPRPWLVDPRGCVMARDPYGKGEFHVAVVALAPGNEAATAILVANAALIVQAVNERDELVRTLKVDAAALANAVEWIEAASRSLLPELRSLLPGLADALEQTRALLQRIEPTP